MRGYSEHRVDTGGRLDLSDLRLLNAGTEVCVTARESRRKQRGVDISIYLNQQDALKILETLIGNSDLFRLELKARLAQLEFEAAKAAIEEA